MREQIHHTEIRDGLTPLVGVERARVLVEEAAREAGMRPKASYSPDELRAICRQLKEQGGMIGAIASMMTVRLLAD